MSITYDDINATEEKSSKTATKQPHFSCPTCDRRALTPATGEIVAYRCVACGELVTVDGGQA